MPRKYTKKKGGAESNKGKNTTSSTRGSSRPMRQGTSSPKGNSSRPKRENAASPPDSGKGKSKKKKKGPPNVNFLTKFEKAKKAVTVLNLTLIPKKSVAELALESRKDNIIEGLKRMNNKEADKIFSEVEIIPGLEAKIYDNTNIELFLLEKKKELKLEYLEGEIFENYIREFKEILAESGRVIAEVIKPDKLPYRYFYKSSGTSRDGTNLAGYYLPLDKIPIENLTKRFKKPEDEFIYRRNEKKYASEDRITLESMKTYKRFMNEMNARICKTLYSGLNIFGVSK